MGTNVDYRLAQEPDDATIMRALATDDSLEMDLKRFSAYIYENRSGHKVGAQHMLAVAPPGGASDIGPSWMVADASTHSRAEWELGQQVKSLGGGRGGGSS